MTNSTTRDEFEAWYVVNAFDYERNPIGSRECGLQRAAWQAARRAALLEAAAVCETRITEVEAEVNGDLAELSFRYCAEDCADAIRALAARG